jgi:hypothetical protein
MPVAGRAKKAKKSPPGVATGKAIRADELPQFLTVKAAAAVPQCTPGTIRRMFTEGRLTRYKFSGRTLVSAAELLAMIVPIDPAESRAKWGKARADDD